MCAFYNAIKFNAPSSPNDFEPSTPSPKHREVGNRASRPLSGEHFALRQCRRMMADDGMQIVDGVCPMCAKHAHIYCMIVDVCVYIYIYIHIQYDYLIL